MTVTNRSTPTGKRGMGIRNINDLRDRCVIDAESGCWRYSGAVDKASGLPKIGLPANVVPGIDRPVTMNARRAGWLLYGRPLKSTERVYPTMACIHKDCCNPHHSRACLPSGPHKGPSGSKTPKVIRTIINHRVIAEHTALPIETIARVETMLAEGVKSIEVSAQLGINPATISRIKNGRHFHQRSVPLTSVFAGVAR